MQYIIRILMTTANAALISLLLLVIAASSASPQKKNNRISVEKKTHFPRIVAGNPTVVFPNGGEVLAAGDTTKITWSGVAQNDTVILEYSANSGQNWLPITSDAANNEYLWETPKISSSQCLARITTRQSGSWLRGAGSSDNDVVNALAIDNQGNIIIAGYFSSDKITFGDVTLINSGQFSSDLFIAKYSAEGVLLWARQAGGADNEEATSATVYPNGDIVVAGYFASQSISFGNKVLTRDSAPYSDMFVVKYDAAGNEQWAVKAGGDGSDFARGAAIDNYGNIIIAGYFNSSMIQFGATILNNLGEHDAFIVKYDAGGVPLWAKNASGANSDFAEAAAVDKQGNIFVTGYFHSPYIKFDSVALNSSGGDDLFLVKYDLDGNVQWAKQWGGAGNDFSHGIAIDPLGNPVIAGKYSSNNIVFNGITLYNQNVASDFFIAKIASANGSALWAKSAGGADNDGMTQNSIAIDNDGNIAVGGFFSSDRIDFENITLPNLVAPFPNAFVAVYTADGGVVSARGAGANTIVSGVAADEKGNMVIGGSFSSSELKIGGNILKNKGNNDVFIWKTEYSPAASDVSNDVFIIAIPTVIAADVDMKSSGVGQPKDSVIVGAMRNNGVVPVRLEQIFFIGADSSAFKIVAGNAPFVLPAGTADSMTIRFTPNRTGLFSATMVLITRFDTLRQTITGVGLAGGAQIVASELKFNEIKCETSKIDALRISNSGTLDLKITSGLIVGPDAADFSLVDPFTPIDLAPDSTAIFRIRFSPSAPGLKSAFFRISSNSLANNVIDIPITAKRETATYQVDQSVIDLGVLCLNETKDTSFVLLNTGTLDNTLYIDAPGQPVFNVLIPRGTSHELFARFFGRNVEGKFIDSAKIVDSICGVERYITIKGETAIPKAVAPNTNLFAMLGASAQGKVVIKNIGVKSIYIESLPSLPTLFDWGAIALPLNIPAGDSVLLPITYTPTDTVTITRYIVFNAKPCQTQISARLQGGASVAAPEIAADTTFGAVGDTVFIPVRVTLPQVLLSANIEKLNAIIVFNSTMLVPIGQTSAGQINGKIRSIPIEIPITSGSNEIVLKLPFRVALGADSVSRIIISDVKTVGGNVPIIVRNGIFHLLGLCYAGGPRLINMQGTIALTIVKPNPGNESIEADLETIELGESNLTIIDEHGIETATCFRGQAPLGKSSVQINVSKLSSGRYFLILRTPTTIQTVPIEIQR